MDINKLKPIVIDKNTYEEAMNIFDELIIYSNTSGFDLAEVKEKIDEKYFIDPASYKYHNSVMHGLFFHSINTAIFTYKYLTLIRNGGADKYTNSLTDTEFEEYLKDGIFAALFHDYCKVGCYIEEPPLTDKQIWKIKDECKRLDLNPTDYIKKLGKNSGSNLIDAMVNGRLKEIEKIRSGYDYRDPFDIGHGEKSVIQLLRLGFELNDHQIIAIRFHMMGMDAEWSVYQRKQAFNKYLYEVPMLKALYLADSAVGLLFEI